MPHPETDLEETLKTGQNPMTQLQKAIEDLSPVNIEIKLYLVPGMIFQRYWVMEPGSARKICL